MTELIQSPPSRDWRRISDIEIIEDLEFWRFDGIPGTRGVTGTRMYVYTVKHDGKQVRIRSSKIDTVISVDELTGREKSQFQYLIPAQRPPSPRPR